MKISYSQFHATCLMFAKDAFTTLSAANWKEDPNIEVVNPLFNDAVLSMIFYNAMAEFLGSTVEIEKPD